MDPASLKAAGWRRIDVTSGFVDLVGGLWVRETDGECVLGCIPDQRHANHIGNVHGGMLVTFADNAFGYCVVRTLGGAHVATAQLNTHFVSAARLDDFITCEPEIVRRTSQLVFVRGLIRAEQKVVASVDGIWKVLEQRPRE